MPSNDMKTLADIEFLEGVRVLMRVDFNVPIEDGKVVDDFRIRAAIPAIRFLQSKGAKVILMSHLESSDGSNPTLAPAAKSLEANGVRAIFIQDYKKARDTIEIDMKAGDCALLENLRFFDGEKANDAAFAKELASLGDIYVNEAFSVSHREHASIVGVPKLMPSYAGLQFEKEIEHLSLAFKPSHPFAFILGGAKFETKLPLITKFLPSADAIFVGGALASDLLKAKGYEVGMSLVSKVPGDLLGLLKNEKVLLPLDIVTGDKAVKASNSLAAADTNMDMGPQTLDMLKEKIGSAKFILWNGPLGMYEKGFTEGTTALAKVIADATSNGATSIVGGGDTLAAIAELGIEERFTFVSTGGGAMLDFLAKGTLPGIEALENSPS